MFQHLCRICLSKKDQMLALHQQLCPDKPISVIIALEQVMAVKLDESIANPQFVCSSCQSSLAIAYDLQLKYRESKKWLHSQINKTTEELREITKVERVTSEENIGEFPHDLNNDPTELIWEEDTNTEIVENIEVADGLSSGDISTLSDDFKIDIEECDLNHIKTEEITFASKIMQQMTNVRVLLPSKVSCDNCKTMFRIEEYPKHYHNKCLELDSDKADANTDTDNKTHPDDLSVTKSERCICFHCDKIFVSKLRLKNHVRQHGKVMKYDCSCCHKRLVARYYLNKPKGKHYVCFNCFNEARHGRNHICTHTGLQVCQICSYKSRHSRNFRLHVLTHTDEKPFACKQCAYKTRRANDLRNHMLTHTRKEPYACKQCAYKTRRAGDLRKHMLTHTGEKPYSCQYCSFKTRLASHLKKHKLIHTDGEKPHVCNHCSFRARQSVDLKRHTLTHTGEKPHACQVCGFKTTRRNTLKRHMLTHTGEKPYSCQSCPFRTRRRGDLKIHIVTHSKEKPHVCQYCSFKCKRAADLNRHILTHNGKKPHVCKQCAHKTTRATDLRRHMLTHTGEKPYACQYCPYKAIRADSLKKHMLIHTEEKQKSC